MNKTHFLTELKDKLYGLPDEVSGTLLTSKIFICKTDTGNVNIPPTTEGGKCKIITSTGNIKIEIGK